MPPRKKAVEQPVSGVDNTGFSNLINTLKTKYPGRIFRGDEYTMPWAMRRLPTGILKLDIDLRGGLPAGGMTMLARKNDEIGLTLQRCVLRIGH